MSPENEGIKGVLSSSITDRDGAISQYLLSNPYPANLRNLSRAETRTGKGIKPSSALFTAITKTVAANPHRADNLLLRDNEMLLSGDPDLEELGKAYAGTGTNNVPNSGAPQGGSQVRDIYFLINSPKFDCFNGAREWSQLVHTAKNPGWIDEKVTRFLVKVIEQGYSISICTLRTGHPSSEAGGNSAHAYGSAVDIWCVDFGDVPPTTPVTSQCTDTTSPAFNQAVYSISTDLPSELKLELLACSNGWSPSPQEAAGDKYSGTNVLQNGGHRDHNHHGWSREGRTKIPSAESNSLQQYDRAAAQAALEELNVADSGSGTTTTGETAAIAAGMCFPCPPSACTEWIDSWGAPRGGGTRTHKGCDLMCPLGTPAYACCSGTITRTGDSGNAGKNIYITQDGTNHEYWYAHMDTIGVSEGQHVNAGDQIGTIGSTGNADKGAEHIHFEFHHVREGTINPWPLLAYLYAQDTVGIQEELA